MSPERRQSHSEYPSPLWGEGRSSSRDARFERRGESWVNEGRLQLLLRQRNRRRHAGLIAVDLGGVPLARGVLDEARVARAEDVLGPVAQADLELARHDDHELAPGRRMPVLEIAGRALAKGDLRGGEALPPLRRLGERDRLDVRLTIGARIESEQSHRCLPDWVRN